MNVRVAIPVKNGMLCSHFGHCEQFYFAEIADDKIVKEEFLTPPEHRPGAYPAWIAAHGAKIVIAGGMGGKAKELFLCEGIEVYSASGSDEPGKLVTDFIDGKLNMLEGTCNRHHNNCGH